MLYKLSIFLIVVRSSESSNKTFNPDNQSALTMTCNGDLFLYLYRTTGSKFACESKFKISNGNR